VDENGLSCHVPGKFTFYAGGQQPDERSEELSGKTILSKDIFYIPDHQSDHGIKEI